MSAERPYVMTIAGHDPSSGAGIAADIKTMEQLKVYGLSVCTATTLQSEREFISIDWRDVHQVVEEVKYLMSVYPVAAIKTGILPGTQALGEIVEAVRQHKNHIPIVVDPVWKSGTGKKFIEHYRLSSDLLRSITLITPNVQELELLEKENGSVQNLSLHTAILEKGGHSLESPGTDLLHKGGKTTVIEAGSIFSGTKHGTGCVLSSAIAASLALGLSLEDACRSGKRYVEKFIQSNQTQLGYHAA